VGLEGRRQECESVRWKTNMRRRTCGVRRTRNGGRRKYNEMGALISGWVGYGCIYGVCWAGSMDLHMRAANCRWLKIHEILSSSMSIFHISLHLTSTGHFPSLEEDRMFNV
jgi:hypothetical protein